MIGKLFIATGVAVAGVLSAAADTSAPIVCLGDSLTSCGGKNGHFSDMLQTSLPEYRVINRGVSGDTLGGGLKRLEKDVLSLKPQCVVLGLGANDYWRRKRSLSDLKRDYEAIVSACRKAGAQVLIISCFGNDKLAPGERIDFDKPGLPLEHYAAGLALIERELVEKYDCGYVPDMQCGIVPKGRRDLWSDKNHPNAAGNRIVADTMLPELRRLLARNRSGR